MAVDYGQFRFFLKVTKRNFVSLSTAKERFFPMVFDRLPKDYCSRRCLLATLKPDFKRKMLLPHLDQCW